MAFDRTNNTDLQALYDERTLDPIGMNYPANDNSFADRINDGDRNVGGETTARPFTVEAMLEALDPTEFDAQQTVVGADVYTHILVGLQGSIEAYQTKWRAMFAQNSATRAALDAQTSPLSRAEVLWGESTTISGEDWIAARIFAEGA